MSSVCSLAGRPPWASAAVVAVARAGWAAPPPSLLALPSSAPASVRRPCLCCRAPLRRLCERDRGRGRSGALSFVDHPRCRARRINWLCVARAGGGGRFLATPPRKTQGKGGQKRAGSSVQRGGNAAVSPYRRRGMARARGGRVAREGAGARERGKGGGAEPADPKVGTGRMAGRARRVVSWRGANEMDRGGRARADVRFLFSSSQAAGARARLFRSVRPRLR